LVLSDVEVLGLQFSLVNGKRLPQPISPQFGAPREFSSGYLKPGTYMLRGRMKTGRKFAEEESRFLPTNSRKWAFGCTLWAATRFANE
jgi:hypothetical protein